MIGTRSSCILVDFFFHIEENSLAMSGHLSIGERWRIVSLSLDQGLSRTQIASIIHCSIRTVGNILQLFHEASDVIEWEGRGRYPLNKWK